MDTGMFHYSKAMLKDELAADQAVGSVKYSVGMIKIPRILYDYQTYDQYGP